MDIFSSELVSLCIAFNIICGPARLIHGAINKPALEGHHANLAGISRTAPSVEEVVEEVGGDSFLLFYFQSSPTFLGLLQALLFPSAGSQLRRAAGHSPSSRGRRTARQHRFLVTMGDSASARAVTSHSTIMPRGGGSQLPPGTAAPPPPPLLLHTNVRISREDECKHACSCPVNKLSRSEKMFIRSEPSAAHLIPGAGVEQSPPKKAHYGGEKAQQGFTTGRKIYPPERGRPAYPHK